MAIYGVKETKESLKDKILDRKYHFKFIKIELLVGVLLS